MKENTNTLLKVTKTEYRVYNPIRLRKNEAASIGALKIRGYNITSEKGIFYIMKKEPEALIKLEKDSTAGYFMFDLNQFFNRNIGEEGLAKFKAECDKGLYVIKGSSKDNIKIIRKSIQENNKKN